MSTAGLAATSAPPAARGAAAPAGPAPEAVAEAAAHPAGGRLRSWSWVLGAAGLSTAWTVQSFRDPDVWWHLAVGRLIAQRGIPASEPFSFLPAAHRWVGQQWGYELLLAAAVGLAGAGLAMLVMGVCASAALAVAARAIPRGVRAPGPARALALLLSGLVAGQVLGVRGQVITVLGTAITLLIVTRWREGSTRALLGLPPLLLLWANLHAGFVAGLALAAVAGLTVAAHRRLVPGSEPAARLGPLALALGASALATVANPAGPGLYGYVAETFANPTLTGGIVEWQSPDFHGLFVRLFGVEAALLAGLWVAARRADPLDVVLALATLVASLQAQRNVALFAVVALPQLARYGTAARDRLAARRGPRGARPAAPAWAAPAAAALVVAATAAAVLPRLSGEATSRVESTSEPRAAADWVAQHLPDARIYSTYEWGGYLTERFPDGRHVLIYGESAVFGSERLEQYRDIDLLRPSFRARLDELAAGHGMRAAVVPGDSRDLVALLLDGWSLRCRDGGSGAVVLTAGAAGGAGSGDPSSAPAC